jgi:hypothetical protein
MHLNYETLTTAPAVTNVPTLTSSLRLLEMSISVWSGRKQDKQATADAANANNADKNILNTTKQLLGDCPELEAVRKFAANTRNFVYASTTAWGDLGQRAFPMSRFPQLHKELDGLKQEFDRLVNEFLSVYEFRRTSAQAKLGSLYNPDEYPSADSLRDKFRFTITFPPVPEANIFSAVQDEAETYLRNEYARVYTQRINDTMKEVFDRLHASLTHMVERLDYSGKEDKKKFNGSLVTNVRDLVGMLADFNITGDSKLTTLHMQLDQALTGVTAEALREDDGLRADTRRAVKTVLSNMSW